MNIEKILSLLDGVKKQGVGKWKALCPVHHEKTPSLSISIGNTGNIVAHCFGCGAKMPEILEALGLPWDDVFLHELQKKEKPIEKQPEWKQIKPTDEPASIIHYKNGKPSSIYRYNDIKGILIGYVCRFDKLDGSKETLPYAYFVNTQSGEMAWRWKGFDKLRPLYGLDRLDNTKRVLITEGEKCADAAHIALPGYACISWLGGSKAIDYASWDILSGRHVILWPDNDDPGLSAMESIADKLTELGCVVDLLDISELKDKPKGYDIYDYIQDGYIPDDFIRKKETQAQEWIPSLASNIDFNIPFDGIARDIQQWIIQGQRRRQIGLSFCSTLAILSTAKGRIQNYEGSIKGNFMMIGLCESGDGKEYCLRVVEEALSQCQNAKVNLGKLVQGQMASGAALIDAINEHGHTCAMVVDEIGHYLMGVAGKKANIYAAEIMPLMTELYTKSDGLFIGKSKKGEPGVRICEPNLTLLGMSSEKQFLDTLSEDMVRDGSLARFFIVFGESDPPPIFDNKKTKLPEHIANALLDVYNLNVALYADDFESNKLDVSDEYKAEFNMLQEHFYYKAVDCNKDDKLQMFKPFYKRLAVKSLQMALLIDDCQSIDVLKWCADINEKSLDIFIKKYNHNVSGNANESWVKMIERSIKEKGVDGLTQADLRSKTKAVPIHTREQIVNDLLKNEQVFAKKNSKGKLIYFWRK